MTLMWNDCPCSCARPRTQGAGDDWPRINPIFRALIKMSTLKAAYDDHHGVDRIVRASDTDWPLARPVALTAVLNMISHSTMLDIWSNSGARLTLPRGSRPLGGPKVDAQARPLVHRNREEEDDVPHPVHRAVRR